MTLEDVVAVVTGASRGAGRGIALELGSAGATVYVTGRSVKGAPTTDDMPGTIDETAAEVTARGGKGVAIRCDHTVDHEVEALFDEVRVESGRVDLLVNNAWGGYEDAHGGPPAMKPFWTEPVEHWDGMFRAGLRMHWLASRHAVPLMLSRKRGLIVNTTVSLGDRYLGGLVYDLAKNAINRLAWAMSHELGPHGIAAVALAPGFMSTERGEENFRRHPGLRKKMGGPSETPAYIGRAVVALANDPGVMEKSGRLLEVGALAQQYGFTDVNGSQPPPFRPPD